ncbi:MAG TPA: hypothetical protein VGN81_23305 [Pseudonocardiaceae bacterium]
MKGKSPIPGLIVVASVLLVAAGLFGTLFFLNRPDPRVGSCLAAAHLLADTIHRAPPDDDEAGMALTAEFGKLCETEAS